MKQSSSQFKDQLHVVLQSVDIPENTAHTAALRARVLAEYRKRHALESTHSFMNLFFKRLIFTTSGAAAVFILGAVLYNQPAIQTQLAKLRDTSTNSTPANTLIAQLSPQEVLADSLAATIGELNNTSKAHLLQVKESIYGKEQQLQQTIETISWKQGLNVRSQTTVEHIQTPENSGIVSSLVAYAHDGSFHECVVDTTSAIDRNSASEPLAFCYQHSGKQVIINHQNYTDPTTFPIIMKEVVTGKSYPNDPGHKGQSMFITIQVDALLSENASIENVHTDIADSGTAVSSSDLFLKEGGLVAGEYNAKQVNGKYEYRILVEEAYDRRKDAPAGTHTTVDTRRNYVQLIDGDAHSSVYVVHIDTGEFSELTQEQKMALAAAQQQAQAQERQATAGAVTAGNTYNTFNALQVLYENAQRGTIMKSETVQKDGKAFMSIHYRYEDAPLPGWDPEMVKKMKAEMPYHEVIATIDPERKQVLKIETVPLEWEQQSYAIEILESTSVSAEESGELLGSDRFTIDSWKADTAALYAKLYPEKPTLQIEDKVSGF